MTFQLSLKVLTVPVAFSSTRPEQDGVTVNVIGNAVVDAGAEFVPAQDAITDMVPPSEEQRPEAPSCCSKLGAPLQSGDA